MALGAKRGAGILVEIRHILLIQRKLSQSESTLTFPNEGQNLIWKPAEGTAGKVMMLMADKKVVVEWGDRRT